MDELMFEEERGEGNQIVKCDNLECKKLGGRISFKSCGTCERNYCRWCCHQGFSCKKCKHLNCKECESKTKEMVCLKCIK